MQQQRTQAAVRKLPSKSGVSNIENSVWWLRANRVTRMGIIIPLTMLSRSRIGLSSQAYSPTMG